jgi:multidrug resistance protein, MATE family
VSRPSYAFEVRSRHIWAIALPASVAFITEPLAGLTDITVIGRLGDASTLGGLVLGALAFDFIFALAYFLRIGTAGLTAQAVGSRDPRDGLLHAARAILTGFVFGIALLLLSQPLLAATTYLLGAPTPGVAAALAEYFSIRVWSAPFVLINYALLGWFYGRAAAVTGMALQMMIHGINILLSIVFVYSLGWGIAGVAFATVLAQLAACAAGLYVLARHYGGIGAVLRQLDLQELREVVALKRMFGLSRDLMIRSVALMGAYAWFAAQGSRMGEVALSANAILLNFLMVSAFFLDGLAQGAEQLCGKAVGANYRPAFERAYALGMRWGLLIAAVLAMLWYAGGWFVIDFMTTNEAVREQARAFLWLAALTALTGMPSFVYDGILIGATLNVTMRNGMVFSLLVFLVVGLSLQPLLGNTGLWIAIHVFFLARAAYYWQALDRQKPKLFTA